MANRQAGKLSKGKYRLLRSLHFTVEGIVYRIIYQIFEKARHLSFAWPRPATRENVYRKLDEMKLKA